MTKNNIGSIIKGYDELTSYMADGKIHYTLSGHSHRAGVYKFERATKSIDRMEIEIRYQQPAFIDVSTVALSMFPLDQVWKRAILPKQAFVVCGSAGPLSRQNFGGEMGGMGMDSPQGLVLDTASQQISFRRGSHPVKPRLAVVLDYLWYEGKPVFEPNKIDMSYFKDITRNDNLFEHATYYTDTSRQPHILAPVNGKDRCRLNPDILDMFFGSPVETVKLHVINLADGKYVGSLTMQADETGIREGGLILLDASGDESGAVNIADFINIIKEREINIAPYYYLSVHLGGAGVDKLQGVYDTRSPWCFPVDVYPIKDGGYALQRGMLSAAGGEVPDFSKFDKIDDYNIPKQQQESHE
jgi:hypothetical protein